MDFYPSITEDLLNRALEYAKSITSIDETTVQTILHFKKSLLFNDDIPWTKSANAGGFDVTMGSYDGAETCELVGIYLLHLIKGVAKNCSGGLYRDDGLIVINNATGPQSERIRKHITEIFKSEGLKITVETNTSTTNFLDITLDLISNKFYPYKKPNDTPMYINVSSNHPQTIIKQLPKMINRRISDLSSTEEEFNKAKSFYENALKRSDHNFKLAFEQLAETKHPTRNRKRKILWYNPPFSRNVQTNIGKKFFALIDKHFGKHSRYHKAFNRNTVKLSYSCMPNIGMIIKNKNMELLNNDTNSEKHCSCRNKNNCPLNGKCLTKFLVYEVEVKTDTESFRYIGLCEGNFKKRYNTHMSSFRNKKYSNSTELSKKIWALKNDNINHTVSWKTVQTTRVRKCGSDRLNKLNIICKYISRTYFPPFRNVIN